MTYLKRTTVEDHSQTNIDQAQMWPTAGASSLHVGIMVQLNLQTQARAHVVLCRRARALSDAQRIDDYSLRFQIEFNFRDAKQDWGLEDFMNVQPTAVTNAANVALFMVNVAQLRLAPFRKDHPKFGLLDVKAYFRGHKYMCETLKLLPQKPEPMVMAQRFDHLATLGSIHNAAPALSMS